jgi:hypothetical protein
VLFVDAKQLAKKLSKGMAICMNDKYPLAGMFMQVLFVKDS